MDENQNQPVQPPASAGGQAPPPPAQPITPTGKEAAASPISAPEPPETAQQVEAQTQQEPLAAPQTSPSPPPPVPASTAPAQQPAVTSTPEPAAPQPSEPLTKTGKGEGGNKLVLIIVGILLVLAIVGGYLLYLLYQKPSDEAAIQEENAVMEEPIEEPQAQAPNTDAVVDKLENVSTSDESNALEADIDATDLTALDEDLSALETEL